MMDDYMTFAPYVEEDSDDEEAGCLLYDFVVCTIVIGLVCVFGLAGNVTSFFVLCKHKTETATIFLLQCMAVFDSLLLLFTFFIYVLPSIYPYTGRLQVISRHCARRCASLLDIRYNMIRYEIFTCSQMLTDRQLYRAHGAEKQKK